MANVLLAASLVTATWAPPAGCTWYAMPGMPVAGGALYLDSSGRLWQGNAYPGFEDGNPGGHLFDQGQWQGIPELENSYWTSVAEDSSGNIWIGTLDGIYRFDGGAWRRYSIADGLADDAIDGLLVDRSGRVWAGSQNRGAASVFDGTTWMSVKPQGAIPAQRLTPLCVDRSGAIWFSDAQSAAYRYNDDSWTRHQLPMLITSPPEWVSQPDDAPIWGAQALDGSMWFSTGRGTVFGQDGYLVRLVGDSLKIDGPSHAHDLVRTPDGTLWCTAASTVGWDHLFRYDQGAWRPWSTADSLWPGSGVRLADRQGGIWFGFDTLPLRRFTPDGVTSYSETSGGGYYSGDSRRDVFPDLDGSLWFTGTAIGRTEGYVKFDGSKWTLLSTSDGLLPGESTQMLRDRGGRYWFGTTQGLSRLDGSTWTIYPSMDSLGHNTVSALAEDSRGWIWRVCSTDTARVSYFDGATWTVVPPSTSDISGAVDFVLADRHGSVWFTSQPRDTIHDAITRFDGTTWTHYRATRVVDFDFAGNVYEDRLGNVWFGTVDGVLRFDGNDWETFQIGTPYWLATFLESRDGTLWVAPRGNDPVFRFDGQQWIPERDGLVQVPFSLLEDAAGRIWSFGAGGVYQFDGTSWRRFGANQGIPSLTRLAYATDVTGALWFNGDNSNVTRYSPDLVPPVTQFISKPPPLVPTGTLTALASTVYEVDSGPEYSWRFDGGPWSAWAVIGSWSGSELADGHHVLEMRARDYSRNVGRAARAAFEVDATPPAPVIAAPLFGLPARGVVALSGTAADARFRSYRLEYRPSSAASWTGATVILESTTQVPNGLLGYWDTSSLSDGTYELRLSVADSLGLVGTALTTVIVDNHAPFFDETAPTKVAAASGGDVYTTNAETHLYFPPHAFAQDAVVMVASAEAGSVPGSLPSGATKVLDGYEIAWAGTLGKQARFTMSFAGVTPPAGTLALYRSTDGTNWERLGGTVDPTARSISLAVTLPGRYALFADNGLGAGSASLSGIAFTPRVFSPSGSFADQEVGISFRLGKPAPVTVKVFSKSGRLIREVATGQELNAGDNLIRWDGRDRNGGIVVDGMYLVTVEALGQTETKTLAVVK